MSEQNLRHRVRDILKPGFVQQVENSVGPGTPDTYFSFDGISGWIELKFAENMPVRDSTAVFKSLNRGLDLEQEAWLYQHASIGKGSSWTLAMIGKRYYLVHGIICHDFNVMTLTQFSNYEIELKSLRDILRYFSVTKDDSVIPSSDKIVSYYYLGRRVAFRPYQEGTYCENNPIDSR